MIRSYFSDNPIQNNGFDALQDQNDAQARAAKLQRGNEGNDISMGKAEGPDLSISQNLDSKIEKIAKKEPFVFEEMLPEIQDLILRECDLPELKKMWFVSKYWMKRLKDDKEKEIFRVIENVENSTVNIFKNKISEYSVVGPLQQNLLLNYPPKEIKKFIDNLVKDAMDLNVFTRKLNGAFDDEIIDLKNTYETKNINLIWEFCKTKGDVAFWIHLADENSLDLDFSGFKIEDLSFHEGLEDLTIKYKDTLLEAETITMEDFGITFLPTKVCNLFNLQFLHFKGNNLTYLPSEISLLKNLVHLDLDYNRLNCLPSEIGELDALEYLQLSYNRLSSLPSEIGKLTNLKQILLRDNNLDSIPSEIGELTSLKHLVLKNNNLDSIPSKIGELTNLKRLYLNNNNLRSMPSEIGKLTNLKLFEFGGNNFDYLPSEIALLTNLTKLNLDKEM